MRKSLGWLLVIAVAATGLWWWGSGVDGRVKIENVDTPVDFAAGKLALLVGISDYRGGPEPLPGSCRDIELAHRMLISRFGFPRQNVRVLLDEDATHRRIVEEFREFLIENARFETEVVFWFCGHGSRIADASGREVDGLDSSLLAYDSRTERPDGSYDVSDDELYSLLEELSATTDRIVLVTDSCHSGGVFRGHREGVVRFTDFGEASLDRALIEPFWGGRPLRDDDDSRRLIGENYVHIAACAASEGAREIATDDGSHGALTWFLVDELMSADASTTWRQVVEDVRLRVAHRVAQTPCYAGNPDRVVFAGRFEAPPIGHDARELEGGLLQIDAGYLLGIAEGSVFEVRPLYGDKAIGEAEAVYVHPDGDRCNAKWRARPTDFDRTSALRAIEVGRPESVPRLHAFSEDAALIEELGLSPWIDRVDREQAQCVLARDSGVAGFSLVDALGIRVWPRKSRDLNSSDPAWLRERVIRCELRYRSISNLPRTRGAFPVSARFVAVGEHSLGDEQPSVLPAPLAADVSFGAESVAGSQYGVELVAKSLANIELINESEEDLFFLVLSLEEHGHVLNVVWGDYDDDQAIAAGNSHTIGVALTPREDWTFDRPMLDRYVIIATKRKLNATPFLDCRFDRLRSDDGLELPWVLRAAGKASTTRGESRPAPVDTRQWGVTWLDLHTTKMR